MSGPPELFCGDVLNDINGRGFVCPGVINRHEYLNVAGPTLAPAAALVSWLQPPLNGTNGRAFQ